MPHLWELNLTTQHHTDIIADIFWKCEQEVLKNYERTHSLLLHSLLLDHGSCCSITGLRDNLSDDNIPFSIPLLTHLFNKPRNHHRIIPIPRPANLLIPKDFQKRVQPTGHKRPKSWPNPYTLTCEIQAEIQ